MCGMGSQRLTPRALGQPVQPGEGSYSQGLSLHTGRVWGASLSSSTWSPQEAGPVSAPGAGDDGEVLAAGSDCPLLPPPTSPPTGGPHPPWPLSDSQRCTPPTLAPAVGTHTAPATAGQPGLASSYSPLGGLLRTPVEGRPCAEAGGGCPTIWSCRPSSCAPPIRTPPPLL